MTIHMVKQQMILVAFMQGSNCSNYPASWRHAQTASGFMTVDYYQNIARVLEAGKFHLAFFDDRLAMPSQYHASYEEVVRHGIRVVMMDLVPLMTAMAMATTHLGLGGTYSTTYYTPFHIARLFATLDPARFYAVHQAWNLARIPPVCRHPRPDRGPDGSMAARCCLRWLCAGRHPYTRRL
jgi:hypothetical protein